VRLRSFVEYGGLLDLRPLADRQARRLAADQVYPADLYVPQRFGMAGSQDGGDDLLDRTLTCLREEVARFVVVLGDFGRGKSFLLRQLTRALPDEHPGLLPVLAAHAVGSGSLLVRTETGGFAFVHQSVMEWLVAKVAADELPETEIVNRKMSPLMVDFLCDLAGHEVAPAWARNVLADPGTAEAAKRNATEVARRLEARVHLNLAGADLRAFDFSELDLRGADLSGADLSGQRLLGKNFAGTDLSGANLSDVRMIGGDLTGAVLTASRWDRAVLVDVAGPAPAEAAVSGRDAATPMLAPLGQDVEAIAFSPDGEFVAMAREHVVELRQVATNRPVRTWRRRAHPIRDIAYAHDGRRIATLEEDGAVYVWDAHTGELVTSLPHRVVGRIWFVEPGNRLVGRDADGLVQFWDSESGAVIRAMQGLYDDLVVSSDGSTVATRRHDKVEVRSGETVVNSWEMAGEVRLALSPSGSAAAACGGGSLTVAGPGSRWSVSDVELASVRALHFVDENRLVVAGSHLDIMGRKSKRAKGIEPIAHLDVTVRRIASSPDGNFAVVSQDRSATVHTLTGKSVQRLWSGTSLAVGSASYSPDGRSLLTTCDDGVLRIWDLTTGAVRSEFTGMSGLRRTAAFSPADPTFAFTTETGFTTIGPDGTTTYKSDPVHWLAISPDGTRLLTASADKTLTLRDRVTGARLAVYDAGRSRTNAVAFSPESGTFAVAGPHSATAVHRSTDKVILLKETRQVLSVAFSPDGSRIATGSVDGTVRVWDLAGEQLSVTLEGYQQPVHDVAFSPDGRRIVTASRDGTARVWSTSGEHLLTLVGHMTTLGSVAYSPDGTRIATTSNDGTARIWDADTGAELAILVHSEESAVLLPDGSYKGDPGDRVWWAVKQVRFEVGELDAYYPEIRRLGRDEVLPGVSSRV
jgi:WD40 repeat protein